MPDSMMRTLLLSLSLLLLGLAHGHASGDCVAGVIARLGTAAPEDADAVVRFAAGLEEGTGAGNGLFKALEARTDQGDAAARVRDVLARWGDNAPDVFEQLSKVSHAKSFDKVVVKLGQSADSAAGEAAVLRWATTKMDPADVVEFEFAVGGRIADIRDRTGNLLEFKRSSGATPSMPEVVARQIFERNLEQSRVFLDHVRAQGTNLYHIIEEPIPEIHRALFEDVFRDFLADPHVILVETF